MASPESDVHVANPENEFALGSALVLVAAVDADRDLGPRFEPSSARLVGMRSLEVYCPTALINACYGVLLIELVTAKGEVSLRLEPVYSDASGCGDDGIVASVELSLEQAEQFLTAELATRATFDLDTYVRQVSRECVATLCSHAVLLRSRPAMSDPGRKDKLDRLIALLERCSQVE